MALNSIAKFSFSWVNNYNSAKSHLGFGSNKPISAAFVGKSVNRPSKRAYLCSASAMGSSSSSSQNQESFQDSGSMNFRSVSDEEWRKRLTDQQYYVTRQKGTERAFTGEYWNTKTPGTYHCICCDTPLFESSKKFDSGTGWPSYFQPIGNNVKSKLDMSIIFMPRQEMGAFGGAEEKDYVLLRNVKVEFKGNDVCGGIEGEENEVFSLCFWIYIDSCACYPSVVLLQNHTELTSSVPFLWLDDKKRMKLFPLLFLHEEAPGASIPWAEVPCASTEFEFPVKKWVHVGCEVLRDLVRLHVDGENVDEKPLTWSKKDSHEEALKGVSLAYPDENENIIHGYVHGLDLIFSPAVVKSLYVKDPPVRLSFDHSSASEIEEDSDGVWSIVGGKASCRRSFSLDVTLVDAFDCVIHKELEVVASLFYADTETPVENSLDAESPLLTSYDGHEYASHDRPCKLTNGRASFKLKISQLSSKCENRLFQIKFDTPKYGKYPFLETLSPPIRCVSRSKNVRAAAPQMCKKSSSTKMNGCDPHVFVNGSMEMISNIVREAKPSPSSKRVKLGNENIPFAMSNGCYNSSHASASFENNAYGANMMRMRAVNQSGPENNSSASDNSEATNLNPKVTLSFASPISDVIIFKYCLGGLAERCQLLKEIAFSASEEQLANFAEQVSLFSGCSHHRQQIRIAKRLVNEGIRVWSSVPENNNHVLWEDLIFRMNESFMRISYSTRSFTDQDFECLRRIAGCRDLVSQGGFERVWSWLYPVACTLSQPAVNPLWNSVSPVWIQGFITKEEAEFALQGPGSPQEPGTFVIRFPTSRSWPHPDAGSLVVTYIGGDHKIRHRLLSLDFVNSIYSKDSTVRPLQELLLQETELSRLGQIIRRSS
ncbi:SH2 domain protein B [Striga hermonthica]|uniref:SH2 domain protein B n=1 Tax=Striga hermonthica TaxID=68872 RepID=A0A9N7MPZ2_STRHE|nr:SH2 domain protein B [Striga hermonthica]